MAKLKAPSEYLIAPSKGGDGLTRSVVGRDHTGAQVTLDVVEERPLTIYLNRQEIVTAMTIGDYPEYLAIGFLRNQGMLRETVTDVEYDAELGVVVVRTAGKLFTKKSLRKRPGPAAALWERFLAT